MKVLLVMVTGGLGFGLFWRRLRRRPQEASGEDPAAALRAKLAESREVADDAPADPEPENAVSIDPASRRQAVHDRARGAIDDLG